MNTFKQDWPSPRQVHIPRALCMVIVEKLNTTAAFLSKSTPAVPTHTNDSSL